MRFPLYTTGTRPRAAIGSWRLRGGSYKDLSQSGNTDRKPATRLSHGCSRGEDKPAPNGDCLGSPTVFQGAPEPFNFARDGINRPESPVRAVTGSPCVASV